MSKAQMKTGGMIMLSLISAGSALAAVAPPCVVEVPRKLDLVEETAQGPVYQMSDKMVVSVQCAGVKTATRDELKKRLQPGVSLVDLNSDTVYFDFKSGEVLTRTIIRYRNSPIQVSFVVDQENQKELERSIPFFQQLTTGNQK